MVVIYFLVGYCVVLLGEFVLIGGVWMVWGGIEFVDVEFGVFVWLEIV